ncbi:uncharacterized protein CLUP02_05045 [Colletotrichum lupini]|uniref:Uncharacterized protein n=1 Tax=Colletotrichum lupini TaxID=145971 RepID=A0A9Q8WEE2_9PEZI|nr:uncharacterized protein CLUP02_05045 [Colletotrichum lupini]UQC79565.1 hypothetical protein CLUP02_05045 [Colletotrichum lupini]
MSHSLSPTSEDAQLNASRDDQIPSRSTCYIPRQDNTKDAASLASSYEHIIPPHLKSRPYGKLNLLQGHVILRSVTPLRHPLGEAPTIYPGPLALCRKLIVCSGPAVEECPLSQRGFAQAFSLHRGLNNTQGLESCPLAHHMLQIRGFNTRYLPYHAEITYRRQTAANIETGPLEVNEAPLVLYHDWYTTTGTTNQAPDGLKVRTDSYNHSRLESFLAALNLNES